MYSFTALKARSMRSRSWLSCVLAGLLGEIPFLGCFQFLLLSHFSRVRLCATPQMAAHQDPPSLGFSRQEHGVGCHFFLQCMKMKSDSEVAQLCPTLSDPMDCSLPGSSVHGIFQARVLEWGAIAFFLGLRPHHSSLCLCGRTASSFVFSPLCVCLQLPFPLLWECM